MVKGWLFVNASHNYPLNDELTRRKLLQYGRQQLILDRNPEPWQRMVNFSSGIAPPYTLRQSQQLNEYAYTAMSLIDGFTPLNEDDVVRKNLLAERIPFTSAFSNLIATGRSQLPASLVNVAFSSALSRVTVPVLVCQWCLRFCVPKRTGRRPAGPHRFNEETATCFHPYRTQSGRAGSVLPGYRNLHPNKPVTPIPTIMRLTRLLLTLL
ncbi:hypothetical protein [Spirosoma arcticum]